jgi:transcriptional regulator with XRE-family HTH domain
MNEDHFILDKIENVFFSETDMTSRAAESSEETVSRAIGVYDLGRKLRQLRLRKKIALADLSKHTGLSASMLSQLETGKLIPTLPTLARIAMVFDVGLEHFFATRRAKRLFAVVRREERMRFPERADLSHPAYFFECLSFATQGKVFEVYLAEFPARAAKHAAAHQHDGAEFVHVLEGALIIHFEDEGYTLRAGDSVYFDPSEPHSYSAAGTAAARAMVVTTPPRM